MNQAYAQDVKCTLSTQRLTITRVTLYVTEVKRIIRTAEIDTE
jgi:hypothetical protein